MKDIKSVMIGFLLATSMFLFMGQTSNNASLEKILRDINKTLIESNKGEIGRYQAFDNGEYNQPHIIDTTTGQTIDPNDFVEDWKRK